MKEKDYFKYYIQGSDHYLIPKYEFKELFNEMNNWKKESKHLETKWKDLKRWLEEQKPTEDMHESFIAIRLADIKKKMKELEGNNE